MRVSKSLQRKGLDCWLLKLNRRTTVRKKNWRLLFILQVYLQVYLQDTAMETWSVDQVCGWLVEKNLGELVHRFQGELFILSKMLIEQSRYWVSSVIDFFFPNACEHWYGVATIGNFHFFTDCSRVCIWPSIHEKT